jgi:hypothetical protein
MKRVIVTATSTDIEVQKNCTVELIVLQTPGSGRGIYPTNVRPPIYYEYTEDQSTNIYLDD